MSDFESYLSHCLDTLEHSRVREAMQYSLMAGGKRIRPRLLLAVLRAYGFEAVSYTHLYVTAVRSDGLGDLFLQLEEVKKKLAAQGLFDPQKKKPLPQYPMRIGVITAKTGAAVQDILTTISRRWPLAEVVVYPSLVDVYKRQAHSCM